MLVRLKRVADEIWCKLRCGQGVWPWILSVKYTMEISSSKADLFSSNRKIKKKTEGAVDVLKRTTQNKELLSLVIDILSFLNQNVHQILLLIIKTFGSANLANKSTETKNCCVLTSLSCYKNQKLHHAPSVYENLRWMNSYRTTDSSDIHYPPLALQWGFWKMQLLAWTGVDYFSLRENLVLANIPEKLKEGGIKYWKYFKNSATAKLRYLQIVRINSLFFYLTHTWNSNGPA